jgi:hypothetical protein
VTTPNDPAALDALLDQLRERERQREFEAEQAERERGRLRYMALLARLREAHRDCDHANGRCERMDVEQAQAMLADKVAYGLRLERDAEGVEDAEPTEPSKRVRRPSLPQRIRQVTKAGLAVTAIQPDGTLIIVTNNDDNVERDEWDGVRLR